MPDRAALGHDRSQDQISRELRQPTRPQTPAPPAKSASEEGADERQIGSTGRKQRDRQRCVNSAAGNLADDAHGGRSIGRFYPRSPTRYF